MYAWRCSLCSIHWPRFTEYKTCPQCGEECWAVSDATEAELLPADEAKRLASYAKFEAWCRENNRA